MAFDKRVLELDPEAETERIVCWLQEKLRVLRKAGVVLGVSGGIDSSVALALCVRAFGPDRVCALLLPEKDSDPESESLARLVAAQYCVVPLLECITPALDGFGCYPRRDEAIGRVFPDYEASRGYRAKIVLPPNKLGEDTLNVYSLTILDPEGRASSKRLPPRELAQVVAASNFKQRTRMAMLYYHAELNNYAVIGTPNKDEHDQGFFVKHGDGAADLKPILHLYKTQVYQLARYLGIPQVIQERPPTSDTYSAPATQEEFFFRIPFETLDLLSYAQEQGLSTAETSEALGLPEAHVQRAFKDFTRKHRTTAYLRTPALSLPPP